MKRQNHLSTVVLALLCLAGKAWAHDGEHHYVNGICTIEDCTDRYQPATKNANGVYELANAGNVEWFSDGVKEQPGNYTDACLTADIDLTGVVHRPIGEQSSNKYRGIFDGQGHRIIGMTEYATADHVGFFGATRGQSTYIRNLIIDSSCRIVGRNYVGAFVGAIMYPPAPQYTTLENCINEADVEATGSQVGGLIGGADYDDGAAYIVNCINRGNVIGRSQTGAFIGKTANGAYIISSYNEGVVLEGQTGSKNLVAVGNVTFDGVCDISGMENATQGSILSPEAKESGELCYKLNGDQSVIRWTQTIGVDKEPVRGTDSEQVYAHGQMLCDGTSAPGTLYNNVGPDGIIKLDHEFDEEGYCIYCGAMCGEIVPTADGWYEISTPFEFRWFAHYVNEGNNSINGRLTSDIDLSNIAWEPIGTYGDAASHVGIQMPFRGVFDGQNHTVYNLNVLTSDARETGLFGRVNGGATIRNIGIVNASIQSEGNGRAGVLAGEIHQSTVTNAFTGGNIVINSGYFQTGGLAGEAASSTLTNCYTTYPILTNNAGALVNCYWGEEIAAQAATGELCYRMNGGTFLNAKWYQTLDEDPCPLLDSSHGLVYPTYDDKYLSASTDEEREKMVGNVIDYESDLYETMIATRVLKDNYTNQLATLMDLPFDEFIAGYARLNGLRDAVKSSETAYTNYINKVKEVSDYLEENQNFGGTDRAVLVDYLTEEIAPNEVYPNGSYLYIVDELVLGIVEIAEEINFVQHLLDMAIAHGYQAGSEITNILTNPDFDGSSEGWTYDMGRQNNITALPDMKSIVSVQDSKLDVNQTLAKPLPGIYEFRINGYAETEGLLETCTYNYGAFVYANGNKNYMHTKYTSLLSEEEVADYPNDFAETFLNVGEDTGWGPKGYNGVVRAFNMGHYLNRILVNVQDGEDLKLGVLTLGSDTRNNDTFFGGARLFYWGTLEEAEEAIEEQLTDMLAIAHHIQDDYPYSESDYESAPNFSAELRDRNSELISRASDATSVQEKYDIIVAFGELFGKIYDCKKSYLNMISLTDKLFEAVCEHGDEAEADEFQNNFYDPIIDAYDNCAYTQQEAEEMTRTLKENVYYLTEFGEEPELVDGVYQITSPYNLSWLAYQVNERGIRNQRVALANDIDMSPLKYFMPIGTYYDGGIRTPFNGSFDGKGHVIRNLKVIVEDGQETGLFGRCAEATISNLGFVDATISNEFGVRAGVLGGELHQCTITNCFSAGNISVTTENSQKGGLAGEGAASKFLNCYTVLDEIAHNTGSMTNCYAGEAVAETAESGELCWKLNQGAASGGDDQSSAIYYQTLGEDDYPTLDSSRGRVYACGTFSCGGEPLDETSYSNDEGGSFYQPHEFGEDGLCVNCGFDSGVCEPDENGTFHLATPFNVRWFSSYVNNGHEYANAVLDADIDMSCIENFTPIGLFCDRGYSIEGGGTLPRMPYKGHFNGQGHVISNLTVTMDKDYEVGFFSRIERTTVENLGFCNATLRSLSRTNHRTGVLAGLSDNCTVSNIFSIGNIVIESGSNTGGIVGTKNNGVVANCFTTYYRTNDDGYLHNCYASEEVEAKAATGELCFLLNNSSSQNPVWRQNLGEDDYPVLKADHKIVYLMDDGTFSNSPTELAKYEGTASDPIRIKTAKELSMLRTVLKPGRMNYVELEENIDMSDITEWAPLNGLGDIYDGKSYMNWIHFEGNGHIISNFTSTNPETQYNSFFGILCGGVYNVGFENVNVVSGVHGSGALASWAGHSNYTDGQTVIEQVWVTGEMTGTAEYCGGMVGNIGGPTLIVNSYANMDVHSSLSVVGGLVGRVRGQLTVRNCYVAGTCEKGGGIVGGGQDGATPPSTYENIVVWNNDYEYFGNLAKNDTRTNVKYYNSFNFAELQQFVVSWDDTVWSVKDDEYPVLIISYNPDAIVSPLGKAEEVVSIYNLAGQRLSKLQKGINIVNGKKILVK